jgi:hypothetical protein
MLAVLYYEYGRASGVICDWPEAERGLNEAYNLDQQTHGPSYMSQLELARLNYDRKQYGKAVEYIDRAMPAIDKYQLDTRDPLGYADLLDEYATSLGKMGKPESVGKWRARAEELRKAFPGKNADTDRTPYGTQCQTAQ